MMKLKFWKRDKLYEIIFYPNHFLKVKRLIIINRSTDKILEIIEYLENKLKI